MCLASEETWSGIDFFHSQNSTANWLDINLLRGQKKKQAES